MDPTYVYIIPESFNTLGFWIRLDLMVDKK